MGLQRLHKAGELGRRTLQANDRAVHGNFQDLSFPVPKSILTFASEWWWGRKSGTRNAAAVSREGWSCTNLGLLLLFQRSHWPKTWNSLKERWHGHTQGHHAPWHSDGMPGTYSEAVLHVQKGSVNESAAVLQESIWKLGISKHVSNFISRKCQNLRNVKNNLKRENNDSLFLCYISCFALKENFQISDKTIKPVGILRINRSRTE